VASTSRTSARSAPSSRRQREQPVELPFLAPSRAEVAVAFSAALDLAEGREPGHAARVCFIALNLAQGSGLRNGDLRALFYGALLHDAGASPASADVCRDIGLNEGSIFAAKPDQSPQQLALELAPANVTAVVEALHAHPAAGAQVARSLKLDAATQRAIASHHERWDGHGYPDALKGEAIPVTGRLIAAADLIEGLIAAESNPLTARRNLVVALAEHAGTTIEPSLAGLARQLARSDGFWLGLHNESLARELALSCPGESGERSLSDVQTFAAVFADLADAKGEHTTYHGQRTAQVADMIAEALAFDETRRELLRIAALSHDIGLLGVPGRIMAKPDILSLAEMEAMRKHPASSQLVYEALPAFDELARWVGAHHERPDGKGYPEMLEGVTIPIEARVIALADTYVALTSMRPYRQALSHEDACQVLEGGAGGQLDPKLVALFCSLPEPKSSRSAPRQRRTR
jgi:HD-GYP domain-containing protein (c-di-GMP phosphodiesterase class II)